MIFKRKRQYERIRAGFRTGFTVLVLFLYHIGAVQFSELHEFFHTEETSAIHSAENEIEPCHRAIYHHEQDQGCHHKSHITASAKCMLCHLIVHVDHLPEEGTIEIFASPETQPLSGYYLSCEQKIFSLLPARAPPFC